MTLPSQEQASATSRAEATQIISAQSQDFDHRRKSAGNGANLSPASSRDVSGKIEATVDDKPAATTPDKLTLSKGSVQTKSGEEALAKERNAEAAAQRSAELAKNIQELDQLAKASSAAASTPEPVASAPEAAPAPQAEKQSLRACTGSAVTPPKTGTPTGTT